MNLSYYIARRLSTGKATGTAVLIIRIAVAGVALSVAIMLIALAIVKGYQLEIRNKITGFSTHIQIARRDQNNSMERAPINSDTAIEQMILKVPGITHLQPVAVKPGIIRTTSDFEGIVVKGIDNHYDWSFMKQYLVAGDTLSFGAESSQDMLISSVTASRLHLKLGDRVTVYFVQDPPRARRFNVRGIYNSGFEDMDKRFVFADLRQVRKLNNWQEGDISGYELSTNDFNKVDAYASQLADLLPYTWTLRTSKDLNPELFDWLGLLDLNVVVIIILMVIVACINMITALLILIVERSNMIGILKALGMRDGGIQRIFLTMANRLILIGLLLGNLIGMGLMWSQQWLGWLRLPPEAYYLDHVPVLISWTDMLLINAGCMIVCYLMLLLPARYVSRILPTRAIRFE